MSLYVCTSKKRSKANYAHQIYHKIVAYKKLHMPLHFIHFITECLSNAPIIIICDNRDNLTNYKSDQQPPNFFSPPYRLTGADNHVHNASFSPTNPSSDQKS